MTKFLLTTTAFLLILPDVAMAQQQAQHDQRTRTSVTKSARTARPVAHAARPAQPVASAQRSGQARPVARAQRSGQARPATHLNQSRPGSGSVRSSPQIQNSRTANRPRSTFRPGSLRTSQFRPIQRPAFRYPRGYSYRRWSIGALLPSLFLSNNYYFSDYAALGVGPPPYGYHWVRYGPDLLLVQNGTRRIVDVIYGAFY